MQVARVALLAMIVSIGCGKVAAAPALPEVLVVVDTDLPVPLAAARLRVDLYAEDGTWFDTSDFGRPDPRDWPASFSVYSERTQIRRERKQAGMDGVEIATLRPDEYTPAMADTMHALYTTTVDKYFHGRRYMKKRFFTLLTERFADRLSWVVARKEGQVIAGDFNMKKDGVIYGRYWGTHVDMPFLHFNVCYYHGVEQAIAEGCTTFNPGAGGEHKKVRGFVPTITHSAHHVANERFRGIVESFLERERRAVGAYIAEERAALLKG